MKTNFEGIKGTKTVMQPVKVETVAPRVNVRFKFSEIKALSADLAKLQSIGTAISEDAEKFVKLANARMQRGA
jgi:hypothetical protein